MAKKAEVVTLSRFRRASALDGVPEIALPATIEAGRSSPPTSATSVDLTGKPKVWFWLGNGGVGKTTYARWMFGRMIEQGRTSIMAAMDPGTRSLAAWCPDIYQPDGSDSRRIEKFTEDLLDHVTGSPQTALMDFGAAGEVALCSIAQSTGGLAGDLEQAGLGVVACFVLSPRIWDIDPLVKMENAGFKPAATLIVLNEGKVDSNSDPQEAFAGILRHSAYRAAVDRGAVTLWLPALDPEVMNELELKLLPFNLARDGQVPQGATFAPIGGLRRSKVARWLEKMEQVHAPVASWLP